MKFQVKLGNKLNAVRRILNLLVCFAILLSLSQTAFAAESSDDEENKILALTMANDAPRTVDLLYYYALKEIGYTPTISIVGNTTTLRMANVGERDGVAFQTKYVGDTFKDIIMVPHYLAELDLNAYINTKKPVNVKTWDDLSNLRVGMIYEKPYLERQVPKDAIVTKFNSSYKLFQSLARNEVDVAVALRVGNQEFWSDGSNVLSATLEHVNGYAYFNKKHASIVPSLSDALTKMYNDGTAQKILNHEIMGEPNEKKLILRISSYNSDSPWDHAITNEMPKNPNVEFINIDLNADRVANHEESWNIITSLLRQDLIGKSPDLIFVSDNEALEFIKECYLQFFETVPVVFCGINNYTPKTIEGFEEYFTGVTETVSALETVNLATKLFPNTKNVFVINDYSRSGKAWRAQIESQLQGLANINVTYNENKPFEDLASRIKDLPENSIIICGEYQSYDDGKDYLEEGSHRLFAEYSSVPIFGLKSTSFGYGQVGGMYSDSQLQGKLAANLINQILETKSMPSVVQPTQSQNKWKFDITPMEEFSLKKADVERLVDNAEYINEPVPFYKSNFVTFVAASLFLGLFVVTTLIFSVLSILTNNRNKILAKSQASLYTAEQLLEKDMTVRELKEYIETVIDTSPIGYALVLDNTVVECNQYMSNHLGFSKGRDLQFNAEIQSFLSNVDGHLGKSVTVPFSTRQGEERRYFLNTTTVEYQGKNAVIIWCTDAEEYEKQNDLLNQLQLELEKIMDTLPLPIAISNFHTLQIRYCNRSFLNLFGVETLEEAQKHKMSDFYPPNQPDGQSSSEKRKKVYAKPQEPDGSRKWEWQYMRLDQTPFDVHVSVMPCDYRGEVCYIGVLIDISDDKKRDRILESMAEKERDASKLKSRFLVNMSHEIRTPMNAIIGLSELFLLNNKESQGIDAIEKINGSAKALLAIINNILDFSKLEAEKLQLQESEFELEGFLTDILFTVSQLSGAEELEIFATLQDKIPKNIFGDKNRLHQILQNIIDNSIKFTKSGEVSIDVSIAEIRTPTDFDICFTIKDTGIGMTTDEVEKLFQPFEQFNLESHKRYSGTGLGTAIAKQLADLMNGKVAITSELGVGTIFTLTLAQKTSEPILEGVESVKMLTFNKTEGRNKKYNQFAKSKIILAEDNLINQEVTQGILELFGTSAKVVSNGQEVLNLLEHEAYDLILMDINMPILGGFDTAAIIRASDKSYKNIPIIAVTGNSLQEEIEKCMECGMNCYVEKPINIDALHKELNKFLPH